jgi:pimeloyl-ACP methyl ester carboxylesterase
MTFKRRSAALALAAAMTLSLTACGSSRTTTTTTDTTVVTAITDAAETSSIPEGALVIVKQGMFSSGGTVTEAVEGEYDAATNWLDTTRAGNTAHVDHANVLYEIPADDNGMPMVYLHGYGQSRMGWMTTPDGRDGWSTIFMKMGYPAFLVDQPRRGEAGSTASMTADGFLDAWSEESKDYKPGDQAWYTHFRIGRVAPELYEGSQFPTGEEAQDQFFRQMTPNTGSYDQAVDAAALSEVLADVKDMTGNKSIFITHSQGGAVGWDVDVENMAAIVAIEPGGTPEIGSEQYNKLLQANIPIAIYFGDYIDNGPEDILSTSFWAGVRDAAVAFAEQYNADGGNCTVYNLPDEGITGNSHFMFQELNNDVIAQHIDNWIKANV